MEKNCRNSTLELARILSILGIIMMHSTGSFFANISSKGINCLILIILNDLGNISVSLFALITGYYGVKNIIKKGIALHQKLFLFSLISFVGISILDHTHITIPNTLRVMFPVVGMKYWYATCYFYLLILSPFLNIAIEKMDTTSFFLMNMVLLFILSIIPTVFFPFPDTMKDGGKGLAWLTFCYIWGGGATEDEC